MSIAEQITRIKDNVASAYVQAEEKGATMPAVLNSDNLPSTIASISGGGTAAIINQNPDGISPMYAWQGTEEEWNNGESKTWYNWKSGSSELGEWVESSFPSSQSWTSVTYGNGKFVAIADSSNVCVYSEDGINWTQGTMPSSQRWISVTYGNGKFVVITYGANICAYSDDGITWTQGTMPSSQDWQNIAYGGGKFVADVPGDSRIFAYSDDGINWTQGTAFGNLHGITYGNGKFVIVNADSNTFIYSSDGINWTKGTMPSSQSWRLVTYGNGKFVAVAGGPNIPSDVFAYSDDGITWIQGTMPSSQAWKSITYGNGKFVAVVYNSNVFAYSSDGINWTQGTMPSIRGWRYIAYGVGKFVATSYSVVYAYLPYEFLQCFTDTSTPTTASKVYSAPSVESTLTIDEVGENDIVLSDMNVYDRNESGDQTVTQSIGEAHPDYLSFIDGVGVRIGTTDIADM